MQISIKKTASIVGCFLVIGAGAALFTHLMDAQAKASVVAMPEDADKVKASIAHDFATASGLFEVAKASQRLASAKLDGYSVCTQGAEATAEQYVEVAGLLDDATKFAPALNKAVDSVMDSSKGMSDCDYRVLKIIGRVAANG